jgi:putative SOS response-associated peptidase YedK
MGTRTVCRLPPTRTAAGRYLGAVCGRYATTRSSVDLAVLFEALDETDGGLVPDYNVAPTDPIPVVLSGTGGRAVRIARWGLVPPWAKDARVGARMINARAETVMSSNAFGPSFRQRRCLVPADGWYEWRPGELGKQAYFMTAATPLVFAGLWTVSAAGMLTSSIVTTASVGHLASVHHRMPLLLAPERWTDWLSGPAEPTRLLAVPPMTLVDSLEVRPVGPAVGDVRNDGPALTARIGVTEMRTADAEATDLTLF